MSFMLMHSLLGSLLSFSAHDLWICIQMPGVQYPFVLGKMSFPTIILSWLHKFPNKEMSYYTSMAVGPLERSQVSMLLQGKLEELEEHMTCRI